MSEISSNNKRIEYIDALRGFTMILVVFSHIEIFSFKMEGITSLNQLFISFRMPLFFFISGFIGYKANIIWNIRTWLEMSKKKLLIQLIPTFVFGLIYAYTYLHTDFNTFIMDITKCGYWFTICLLEMFLIIYTLNLIVYNTNSEIFKKRQFISIVILSVILWGLCFNLDYFPHLNKFCKIFSLHKTFDYFPYFAFGYLCSMNKEFWFKMLENKVFTFIIIFLFTVVFYINVVYISPNLDSCLIVRIIFWTIRLIVGFLGLLIVYNTFRVYQGTFTSDKKIGRSLQYIGKRTLDIYMLHYFFLPYLPQVGLILQKGNNAILELALGLGVSLIVIGVCLVVSNILRTNPILAKYLFGVKSK